jgi:serine/threonine protein kinase
MQRSDHVFLTFDKIVAVSEDAGTQTLATATQDDSLEGPREYLKGIRYFPHKYSDRSHITENNNGDSYIQSDDVFVEKRGIGLGLEDFDVVEPLGCGKSGRVYLVSLHKSKRFFALKEICIGKEWPRLSQELQARQDGGHTDHVVRLLDFFLHDQSAYLVLEYMDWGSLEKLLRHQRRVGSAMDEGVLSIIVRSILHALDFLQQTRGLIHRDLKPANVVLGRSGAVKLTDCGLSPVLTSATKFNCMAGGDIYMSPEQMSGRPYSPKADIWSLGIIAAECAQGRHPYPPADAAESYFARAMRIVHGPSPAPAAGDSSGFSDALNAFLQSCLAKEEALRPSAQELLLRPFIAAHAHEGAGAVRDMLAAGAPPSR